MTRSSFTRLKTRITYFRRKVPSDLRAQICLSEVCLHLGPIETWAAGQIGRALASATDQFFLAARNDSMLSKDDLYKLLTDTLEHLRDHHRSGRDDRASTPGLFFSKPIDDEARLMGDCAEMVIAARDKGSYAYTPDFVAERLQASSLPSQDGATLKALSGDLSAVLAIRFFEEALAIIGRNGLSDKLGREEVKWRRQAEFIRKELGMDSSPQVKGSGSATPLFDAELASALAKALQSESFSDRPTPAPVSTPVSEQPPIPTTPKHDSFGEIHEKLIADRASLEKTDPSGVMKSVKLWLAIAGDKPLTAYTEADMNKFMIMLKRMPKHYWKSEKERQKSILTIIDEADARNEPARMIDKTINKHVSQLSALFEYAQMRAGKLPRTAPRFWEGHLLKVERSRHSDQDERPRWDRHQIKAIFEHPVWRGRKSRYYFNAPGKIVVRDALYWAPLIAALQGMRIAEIVQLRVRHIVLKDAEEWGQTDVTATHKVWCFDLPKEMDLKNQASQRVVPLHPGLLSLNFVEEKIRGRKPDELVFTDVKEAPALGSLSDYQIKRFGRVIDKLGLTLVRSDGDEADGAFHPFRHSFATEMAAFTTQGVIDWMMGHSTEARSAVASRYQKAQGLWTLKTAIDKLVLPIDYEALNDAWKRYGAAVR